MITLENISFHYQKTAKLFDGLNLKLAPGSIYGLLGKNGAGKTTLFKIISGLLFPQSGNCNVLDFTPKQRHAKFLADIYFMPEEFFLPDIEIKKYLQLYAPFYKKFDFDIFYNSLKEFELSSEKNLGTYSYGQKKKFLLAFVLATECDLVLLDEPTNGLDIPSKSQFRKLLTAASRETRTFLIATHQVREVEYLIDPIIILDNGKIIFNQSIDSISQSLTFSTQAEPPGPQVFYSEKTFNGYQVVMPKKDEYESEINIEMLFKAVLTKNTAINSIFKNGEMHE